MMKSSFYIGLMLIMMYAFSAVQVRSQDLDQVKGAYSSYLGGSSADRANALRVDKDGFLYIAGFTKSDDFPVTTNAYAKKRKGDLDGYILKFDPKSNEIVWATYLGGSGIEYLSDMEVDAEGNVYVIGNTRSPDFPVTENAWDRTYNGDAGGNHGDLYISKLKNDGSKLIYSTYLGGSGMESFENFELDASGCVYLCTSTSSADYPITDNAFDKTYNGKDQKDYLADIAITKLSADGSKLLFSTFLSGNSNESAGIRLDNQGNLIVSGATMSADFPVTNNSRFTCRETNFMGDGNLFLSMLDANTGAMKYSTYIDGDKKNSFKDIFIDQEKIWLSGEISSSFLGLEDERFENTLKGEKTNFIMSFDIDSRKITKCRFLEVPVNTVQINEQGNFILTGLTIRDDLPVTKDAIDATYNGCGDTQYPWGGDFFICIMDRDLNKIEYASYLGGTGDDYGMMSLIHDKDLIVVGSTKSEDFPVTKDALYPNHLGGGMQGGDVVFLKMPCP